MKLNKTYLFVNAIFMIAFICGGCSVGPKPDFLLSNADQTQIVTEKLEIQVQLLAGMSKFDKKGREAADKGDFAEALDCFRLAIDANPTDSAALYNAAVVSLKLNQPERAESLLTA